MVKIPRCPSCRGRIIQKAMNGKIKIRTKILAFDGDSAEIVCGRCGADVPLDIQLGGELKKALFTDPKLILKKNIDYVDPVR